MRISEVAKITGLSVSNIRFYEKKGLLAPDREDENHYRDYSAYDIKRLKLIMLYRKMDFPLEIITDLLQGRVDFEQALALQIDQLQEKKAIIEGSIRLCQEVSGHALSNSEDIDYYLSYVKEEEERGVRFGGMEEFLDNYSDVLQYNSFFGNFVHAMPGLRKKDHIFRCLWSAGCLLLPAILLLLMVLEGDTITFPQICVMGMLMLCLWTPAIKSYLHKDGM